MNNGNQILTAQNLDINIDKLLAQRKLYSNAKVIQYALLIITVVFPISLSIITNYTTIEINEKSWLFASYSILALTLEKIIENIISRHKKTAASIQEKFDIDVLGIAENDTLNLVPIDFDIIRSNSIKEKENEHKVFKVRNWYSIKIKNLQTNVAVLFCQRMNICYDSSIKKKYNIYLLGISILTSLLLLLFSLLNDFTLQKFIVEVIFPSVPIFAFTYKEVTTNRESIDNLEKLKEIIERELDNSNLLHDVDIEKIRRIQDRIYNNRVLSPLIPNFIYNILWTKLEDEMNYSVENRIDELN